MISIKNGKPCHLVDTQDRAFLYGDGFFTTVKITLGEPHLWQRHIDRLIDCAEKLAFDVDIEEGLAMKKELPQNLVDLAKKLTV